MKKIFADTFYWTALLNPRDQWHQSARDARQKLGNARVVTTETVLIEILNFFSEYGAEMRQTVVDTTHDILVDRTFSKCAFLTLVARSGKDAKVFKAI